MDLWAWDRLAEVAAASPHRVAVRHGEATIGYGALVAAATGLAGTLDLDPGDRAIVSAPNSIPALVFIAAIWRRGAIPVLVHAEAPPRHLAHAREKTGARLVCAGAGSVAAGQGAVPVPDRWTQGGGGVTGLPPHGQGGADPASIVFTSGSTGLPKGVTQRAATLIDGALRIRQVMGYDEGDSILCPVPFTFDYGWGQALSMFFTGVPLVLPEPVNGFGLCAALAAHRPTVFAGVPAVFADLLLGLAPLAQTPRDSIRLITNTGSKIPNPVFDALTAAFPGASLSLNYGLTETYRSATLPFDLAHSCRTSVGRALPGADLVILRADGSRADPGEEGEICHFGAGLFDGYWNDPEKTEASRIRLALPDGRCLVGIRTGDFGHFDEGGLLYLHGRRDRIVKCMGVRISLAEIEDELHDTGLVREAAVTAAEHDVFGSFLTAHVVPHPGAAETEKGFLKTMRAALRDRLSPSMLPRRFLVHTALPRTTSRKVDYVELTRLADHEGSPGRADPIVTPVGVTGAPSDGRGR
jgi:acyl-CoA synthetase (AMP-forming)/AMP-acid ligase II